MNLLIAQYSAILFNLNLVEKVFLISDRKEKVRHAVNLKELLSVLASDPLKHNNVNEKQSETKFTLHGRRKINF